MRVVDLEPRAPGRGVVQPIGRGADPTGVAEVGQGLAVGVEEIRWQVVAWVGWGLFWSLLCFVIVKTKKLN